MAVLGWRDCRRGGGEVAPPQPRAVQEKRASASSSAVRDVRAPRSEPAMMTEELIFHAALERADPAERSAYLNEACAGDTALRRRVEGLLQAHDTATGFLEPIAQDIPASAHEPARAAPTLPDSQDAAERMEVEATRADADEASRSAARAIPRSIAEGPGTRIGPYKLLEKIGEGGMGVVYLAEQEMPVRRRVALKIIKPGMDTEQVVARFEAERQALALMDHPNIAKVLDAGATDSGRPYFVMELVNGVPITEYCDNNPSTPRERLELFIPVCQADPARAPEGDHSPRPEALERARHAP